MRQIELLILRGVLRPAGRLPSERDLADRLGVSRSSLRDALAELQSSGLLVSRARAGLFVAEVLGSAFSPALAALFASHDEAVFDYLSFRRDMEELAAMRAATLGSDIDREIIAAVFGRIEAAHIARSDGDEARLDAEFHLSIIDASQNVVMLHMMRSMYDLLRGGVFYNRQVMFEQHSTRSALLDQHRAINAGLQARNGADRGRGAYGFHRSRVGFSPQSAGQ